MDVKEAVKEQVKSAYQDADFPFSTYQELLAAFPCGADGNICLAGDITLTPDHAKNLNPEHFPVATPEEAAELFIKMLGL